MSTTYIFSMPELSCIDCVNTVNACLRHQTIEHSQQTITLFHVNASFVDRNLTITIEEDDLSSQLVADILNSKLETIGFSCKQGLSVIHFLPGFAGVISGFVLLLLPFVLGPMPWVVNLLLGLSSVVFTSVLGFDSFRKAMKLLINHRQLHMDTLFTVSTLTAMTVSVAALFVPGLPMMFEAGLLIFGFRQIGEALRKSLEQDMGLTARFQDRAPKQVKIYRDGQVATASIDEVQKDDLILIEEGDVIPVDGVCEQDEGMIDSAIAYGCLEHESCSPGFQLYAGMRLDAGRIIMKAGARASESLLARKDASIAASIDSRDKASWETDADKILTYFIPTVFVIAILSGIVAGYFFSPALAIQCSVAVLVSACPCTLGLVTGLASRTGMRKAIENNVVFKSTRTLEDVNQIEQVVFDLNGTLTTRKPLVKSFHHSMTSDAIFFDYLMTLEAHSSKSIAEALCLSGRQKGFTSTLNLTDLDTHHFSGLKAIINGEICLIGNQKMMQDAGVLIDSNIPVETDETVIYLACGQRIMGHVILERPHRKEAIAVIDALKQMGKQVYMCTGSDKETALRYAALLGIVPENVCYQSSSDNKVAYIRSLQHGGMRVAMVGDEENDADAIAASDFGLAMPTDGRLNMTQRLANAVSRVDSLDPIVSAFEVSQQTATNVKQNLIFNLSYNVLALLLPGAFLFFTGLALNPGVGVALMILQTSLILLNTYWFKQQDLVYLREAKARVAEQTETGSVQSSYHRIRELSVLSSSEPVHQVEDEVPQDIPACDTVNLTGDSDTNIPGIFNRMGFANTHS